MDNYDDDYAMIGAVMRQESLSMMMIISSHLRRKWIKKRKKKEKTSHLKLEKMNEIDNRKNTKIITFEKD